VCLILSLCGYVKKPPILDYWVKNIEKLISEADFWTSAGSIEHWLNSIDYAFKNGGYTIWGQRLGIDSLKEFFEIELRGRRGRTGVQRPFIVNYVESKPLINIFYVRGKGVIGAGLVSHIVIDVHNLFWDEELKEGRVIYPLRWVMKVIWLHKSVRENPTDPRKWEGDHIDLFFRSGLQHVVKPEDVEKIRKFLLSKKDEIQVTLNTFSKEVYVLRKPVIEEMPSMPNIHEIIKKVTEELVIDEEVILLFITSLLAGRNVMLAGKPGTGKTMLAKMVSELLGFKPLIAVANAHWSRYDVIGGMVLKGGKPAWKSGWLIIALTEHLRSKHGGGRWRGAYLIIDEVNRADVDKAFGEFFTIFAGIDPSEWIIPESLIKEIRSYDERDSYGLDFLELADKYLEHIDGVGYRVPDDFRVICTLNYVDIRNLFILGEAFTRRFARILVNYPSDEDKELNVLFSKAEKEGFRKEIVQSFKEDIKEKLKKLINELRKIERLPFGPANVYSLIRIALTYKTLNPDKDNISILKKSLETSISLSTLWDEELKKGVERVINNVLGSA